MTTNNSGRLNLMKVLSSSFTLLFCLITLLPSMSYSLSVSISRPSSGEKVLLSENVTVKAKVSIPDKPEKEEKARVFWFLHIKDHGDYWFGTTKSEEEKEFILDSKIQFPEKNSSFGENTITAYCPDQIYEGRGGYYGEGALKVTILEEGGNYEGFILPRPSPSEQDMVIGENTGDLEGCVYYIEGYCTDAREGVPDVGDIFGIPWTSTSTTHWAYWERQAIIYANKNNYSDDDTLKAIWYISDRSGSYNEILENIGYPPNGPTKNWEENVGTDTTPPTTPVVIDDGTSTRNNTQLHASWSCEEPESGIVEYLYAIGTTLGGTDTVNWESAGGIPEVTKTGLRLRGGTYYFSVKAKNGAGLWSEVGYSDGIKVIVEEFTKATVYSYPNPFNPDKESTNIRFTLEKSANVKIKIFDVAGDLVWSKELNAGAGETLVAWDGKNEKGRIVANGVYLLKVEAEGKSVVKKIVVLR